MTLDLVFTVNPGLETVVREEFAERIAATALAGRKVRFPPSPAAGRVPVRVAASAHELEPIALAMRSVHHVVRGVDAFTLPATGSLDAIRARLAGTAIPGLTAATPFRVTSNRSGRHPFTSMDIQAAAGAGIRARSGAPVDLKRYAVNVQVDVVDDLCLVGIRWSRRALSLRFERPYRRRVALAANVAHAMLRLAAPGPAPARVLDPCCGTGTILLEAGMMFPQARLIGGDTDPRSVEGAGRNLAFHGLAQRSRTLRADARDLAALATLGPFDAIVVNPPFGRRLGRRTDFRRFYGELLAGSREIIAREGRLVLLADRRGAFNRACRDAGGWHIRDVRIIELGDIHPGLFVLTPIRTCMPG